MKELSIREAAAQWGVSSRRLQQMCKDGRVAGARKAKRTWLIPAQAEIRVRSKAAKRPQLLPLPVGISGYIEIMAFVNWNILVSEFIK